MPPSHPQNNFSGPIRSFEKEIYMILDSNVIALKASVAYQEVARPVVFLSRGGKLLICLRAKISPSQTELNQSLKSESLLKVKLNPRHLLIYRAINEG